jgi:hypothetical protein
VQQSFRSSFVGFGFSAALVSAVLLPGVLVSRAAVAAKSPDAAALELADQAIFTDYLQLDFVGAEKKLKKALALCEKEHCSPTVTAQVDRDLAVNYITGMKRSEEGHQLLIKALRLDPRIALDADLTTPELVRIFNQAKQEAARGGGPEPEPEPAAPAASEELPVAKPEAKAEAKPEPAPEPAAPPEASEAPAAGSMDAPRPRGSVDCPPDFPGCETVSDEGPRASSSEKPRDLGRRNWFSVGLQQDFLTFSGQTGVCGPNQPDVLSCFRAGDTYRQGTADNTAGNGGAISGGLRPATTRLLVGYDRILFQNFSAGLRLGYAIGGGPKEPAGRSFVPFHAELRGMYWFGPIEPGKLRPYALVGGGLAQVDSSVTTEIVDRCPGPPTDPQCTTGQVQRSRVTVWKKTGTTFASAGGGALYPIDDRSGINAELKLEVLFPSSGTGVALQAGYIRGF